jgi:2-polyprenyl-3-methyl-5-hydroxy-6-metoxy-1,4-benzoquinol methylase
MDSTYAEVYPELYRRHWWWRVREEILLRRITALFPHDTRSSRILDVGCGAGLFFDALEQFGHVEGIESDATAVARAGRWRERIFHGRLDSFKPPAPYDVILMLDVLEHLEQPEQLLHDAQALLTPEGVIVITVPAFNWLWTRHDDLNHHVWRYTASQMRRTVTAAGLRVTDSTYLFQSLVIAKALVRLKETLLQTPPDVPNIPGEPLNSAIQAFLRTEYAVARWLPFGTSLMMIAKLAQ